MIQRMESPLKDNWLQVAEMQRNKTIVADAQQPSCDTGKIILSPNIPQGEMHVLKMEV